MLDGGDVGLLVDEPEQLVVGGREPGDRHVRAVEDAELPGQRHRQLDPDGVQGMPGTEVVGDEPLVPEDVEPAVLRAGGGDGSALLMTSRYRAGHVTWPTHNPHRPLTGPVPATRL